MKDKNKTILGLTVSLIVFFVLGFGTYYIYDNKFSKSAKIIKCADGKFIEVIELRTIPGVYLSKKTNDSYTEYQSTELPIFLKKSVSEKLKDSMANIRYPIYLKECEDFAKMYPESFKKSF